MKYAPFAAVAGFCVSLAAHAQVTEKVSPYLTRVEPEEWVLKSIVTLRPNLTGLRQEGSVTVNEEYDIEQGTIFFPLAMRSASHDRELDSIKARMLIQDARDVNLQQSIVDSPGGGVPLHSGEAYGNWVFEKVTLGPSMIFEVESRVTTWNTKFDEKAAMQVDWPTGEWPAEAASTFDDELFINEGFDGPYEMESIEELAERIVRGKAKTQPPMVAAKWIAGEVAKAYQPHGRSIVTVSRPATAHQQGAGMRAINSFNVIGAAESARLRKGSEFDLALLLTAVYREVGLPARLVVGYVGGSRGGMDEPFRSIDKPEIGPYAWVEVALYDENQTRPDQQLTWVPVDIIQIRSDRVYGRPFDQAWEGFGTSEKLNEIIPIAFHLHPHRMGAISYGADFNPRRGATNSRRPNQRLPRPSLWGWNTVPELPAMFEQSINFSATTPSRGPGDPRPGERRRGQ